MYAIDTHAHLYVEEFEQDLDEVIERAINAGITSFFLPAISSEYTEKMYELEKRYPKNIHLMCGLHPCYVKENYKEELAKVEGQLQERSFAAIGEIGIDLYWDKSTLPQQVKAFEHQIQLAIAYDMPIVIHSRDSFNEIFEVLEQNRHPKLRGIFHCFSGTYEEAHRAIELGFMLGIGGVVTFKNGKIDQFIHRLPLSKLVLETDSPYLAPVPFRGKRNEPAYTELVIDKLASLFQTTKAHIVNQTTINAREIFKK